MTDTWGDRLEDSIRESRVAAGSGRVLIKGAELKWEDEKMARSAIVVSDMTGFALRTMHSFIAEIPAGGRTGRHRHNNEAVILCLSGCGYTVVEGERYDWESGDVLAVPIMSWHQHFNASETEACRYYGVTNLPLMRLLGLAQIETAQVGEHVP